MIGTHSVLVYPESSDPVDLSCLVDDVSVIHGRDDTESQPTASSATVNMSQDVFPAAVDIGDTLTVTTSLPGGTESVRFTGKISDIVYGWEDEGEETPNSPVGQIIATGTLADLGRRIVGDVPFPQELDGARVARIMTAAGVPLNPAYSDPGAVQILARDIDSQPALDTAQAVAGDARGVLWQTRGGDVRYADANHRRGVPVTVELDACDILVTPTWRRTVEGLINDVSIGYGVAAGGGEQPRYLASDADSIARYGEYGLSAATQLAALADAQALGTLLVTRNRVPVWIMGALPVGMEDLSEDVTALVLGLDMHSLISLTGLPAVGSAPTSAVLWVEGYREYLAFGVHELDLVVTGYCRTSPPPRWDDVPAARTWDSMGTITWNDATCFGPIPSEGRWNDVPASLRWDQIPNTVAWDEWTRTAPITKEGPTI